MRRASSAKPSTGHIAVANQTEAGLWGVAHSCWPTGSFNYAWLQNARLLYADDRCADPSPRCLDSLGIRVNEGLEEALQRGHEVLLQAPAFILVPAAADPTLRALLDIEPPRPARRRSDPPFARPRHRPFAGDEENPAPTRTRLH